MTTRRALAMVASCLAIVLLGAASLALVGMPGALRNAASEPEDVALLLVSVAIALGAGASCGRLGAALWNSSTAAGKVRGASTAAIASAVVLALSAGLSALAGGAAMADGLVLAALAAALGGCAWQARSLR